MISPRTLNHVVVEVKDGGCQILIHVQFLLFYLRGKSRRADGGNVLEAQVLRGVGK